MERLQEKKKNLPLYMRIERVLYKNLPKVAFLRIFSIINYYVNNKENKKSYEKSLNK